MSGHKIREISREIREGLGLGFDEVTVAYGIGSQSNKVINQDYFWPFPEKTLPPDIDCLIAGRLYIVTDGVSGGLSGEQASQIAAESIAQYYYQSIKKLDHYPADDELKETLQAVILQVNRELQQESEWQRKNSQQYDSKDYLQTTLAAVLLRGKNLFIIYIGDSRVYRLRDNNDGLFDVKFLSGERIEKKMFIGTDELTADEIFIYRESDFQPDDLLLVCSDGLYNYISPQNRPDEAEDTIAESYSKYKKEGLKQVAEFLLEQADDEKSSGGGDNITAMLIQPAKRLSTYNPKEITIDSQQIDESQLNEYIELWLKALWIDSTIDELTEVEARQRLGEWCTIKAKTDEKNRKIWLQRAKQLGIKSALDKAEERYQQRKNDIENDSQVAKDIIELLGHEPDNVDLFKLAYRAVMEWVSLLLIEDKNEEMEEPLRLLARLAKEPPLLDPLNSISADNELIPAKTAIERLKEKPNDDELQKSAYKTVIDWASTNDVLENEGKMKQALDLLASLYETAFPHSETPSLLTSKAEENISQDSTDSKPKLGIQEKTLIGLFALVLIVLGGMFIYYLSGLGGGNETPIAADTPAPTVAAAITPTHIQEPTATIPPNQPTKEPPQISLQITENEAQPERQNGARLKVNLTTQLKLSLDETFTDLDATLVLTTQIPPGLQFSSGGQNAPKMATDSFTQSLPFKNVDPRNIIFESRYIVTPTNKNQQSYHFNQWANLVGSDGQILATMSDRETISIPFRSAFEITQEITPTLVTRGDPLTYTLYLQNTGETIFENFEPIIEKQEWRTLKGLTIHNDANSQRELIEQLSALRLEPGSVYTVMVRTSVVTNYPQIFSPTMSLKGMLADDTVVTAATTATELQIYATGMTTLPQGYSSDHPVWRFPGGSEVPNNTRQDLNGNGIPLRVLDAQLANNLIWYQIEEVVANTQQPVRGWLWKDRVAVDPAVEQYLQQKARGVIQ